jgi:branched-chain amino acid transport system permease protein
VTKMKTRPLSDIWLLRFVLVALPLAATLGLFDEYTARLIVLTLIFSLLAAGLNVAFGEAGQLLLCQAAFFGVAGYSSALLVQRAGLSFWVALPLSAVATAAFGAAVGWVSSRTSGHYLAMFTMSISIIFHQVALNWVSITNGASGLRNIPRPESFALGIYQINFENNSSYLIICSLITLGAAEALRFLRASMMGRLFLAVREDELAARSLGIRSSRVKLVAITWAALLAGLAGPLYTHSQRLIAPDDFTVFQSVMILLMVILGGSSSLAGPFVGATLLVFLPEHLRAVADYRWITFGVVLIVCMIYLPDGIRGAVARLKEMITPRERARES